MMKYGSTHLDKRGFTLIELLVVVAIISLLVSILIPSLQNAKALATQVVCQSNFHSIGQATYMYTGDNQGMLPTILSNLSADKPGIFPLMHSYLTFYSNPDRPFDSTPQWACPVSIARNEPYFPFGRPFAINAGLVFGRRSTHLYDGMWGGVNGKTEVQADDVPNSASLIWMTEPAGIQWDQTDAYYNFNWRPFCFGKQWGMAPWPEIEFYHMDDRANFVFIDGHVEGILREDSYNENLWVLNE